MGTLPRRGMLEAQPQMRGHNSVPVLDHFTNFETRWILPLMGRLGAGTSIHGALVMLTMLVSICACPRTPGLVEADAGTDRAQTSPTPARPCGADADCASGFCSDGFCCDRRCAGSCVAC